MAGRRIAANGARDNRRVAVVVVDAATAPPAELPLIVVAVTARSPEVEMPPPPKTAELPLIVPPAIVSLTPETPPPASFAELPLIVLPVSVRLLPKMPPPLPSAELPLIVLLVTMRRRRRLRGKCRRHLVALYCR